MAITVTELLHKIANAKSKDLLIHHFLFSISALFSLQTIEDRKRVMNLVKQKMANLDKEHELKSKLVFCN